MATKEDLDQRIDSALTQAWTVRDGRVVPTTENVQLAGGAVELAATMLYSDLADSTELAMWDRRVTARLCKAFLACATHLIKAEGGEPRSFDGDRVMGVFLGSTKNTSAVRCALKINWMFRNQLKPKFEAKYEAFRNGTYKLAQCTGVDTSDVFVVRTGVREHNDLIWVGRAPNVAAKLSGIRDTPFHTFITDAVFNQMMDPVKVTNGAAMWEERVWSSGPVSKVYRSSWEWKP